MPHLDPKYYLVLVAVVILVLVFIKKLWKIALVLALLAAAYWYFLHR